MSPLPAFIEAVRDLREVHQEPPSRYRHPLSINTFGDDEIAAALEVLIQGPLTIGDRVREFERRFAARHGSADAVFVNSGSSANLLALSLLARPREGGLPPLLPGDEVIVPAVTWATTIWPVAQVAAVPVFVDVAPQTLNMTVDTVERAITPKTRAVFVTHLLGNPAPVAELSDLCSSHGITLIEDACESLAATLDDKPVGTFGRLGTYSFYFSHHICTIEGGMIICDDPHDAESLRVLRAHGWSRQLSGSRRRAIEDAHPDIDPRFLFVDTGYNLRPTELQAAIGLVQFDRLDGFLSVRRRTGLEWAARRDRHPDVFLSTGFTPGASHFAFPIVLRPEGGLTRATLAAFLEKRGVETRPLVAGNLARQPATKSIAHRIAGPLTGADLLHEFATYVGLPCVDGFDPNIVPDALDALVAEHASAGSSS